MPSKDGWNKEHDHDKITLGKKQYRNMEEWSRPCAVCGKKFEIVVRAAAGSVNASFGLRTCKEHRGQKTGAAGVVVSSDEIEALKAERDEYANAIMDHLQEKGVAVRALKTALAEIEALKAQLAKYELQPRMTAMQNNMDFPWKVG